MGGRTHGKNTKIVLKEIKNIHGSKFLYDKFSYVNSNTKVILGCKIHGYFKKYTNDVKRINGGCPKCNNSWQKTHNEFLTELPTHIKCDTKYKNAKTKIIFRCIKHKEIFKSTANSILLGHINCPECIVTKAINSKLNNSKSVIDPKLKTNYENYCRAVWRYTNRNYKKFMSNQKRNRQNHIDHVLSIVKGFNNKLDPKVVGSIHNLRIITSIANQKKSYKSDITIKELIKRSNK